MLDLVPERLRRVGRDRVRYHLREVIDQRLNESHRSLVLVAVRVDQIVDVASGAENHDAAKPGDAIELVSVVRVRQGVAQLLELRDGAVE